MHLARANAVPDRVKAWLGICAIGLAALSAPTAATAGPTLDRIVSEKVIRLGVRTDAPPFAALDGNKLSGFSVDLCALVASAIVETSKLDGLRGQFVQVNAVDRFDKLRSGEIDVLCGATTASLSRRETMSFSIPIFMTGVGAAVRTDAPALLREVVLQQGPAALSAAALEAALDGRTVGVRKGTTAEKWIETGPVSKLGNVKVEKVDDHGRGFEQLRAGATDVYFADHAILQGLRHGNDAKEISLSRDTFTLEPLALALPKGDEELRLVIDRALSHLYRSGRILKIFEHHFGAPKPDVVRFYALTSLPE